MDYLSKGNSQFQTKESKSEVLKNKYVYRNVFVWLQLFFFLTTTYHSLILLVIGFVMIFRHAVCKRAHSQSGFSFSFVYYFQNHSINILLSSKKKLVVYFNLQNDVRLFKITYVLISNHYPLLFIYFKFFYESQSRVSFH